MATTSANRSERFASLNQDEFEQLLRTKDSDNTVRATRKSVAIFREYLTAKQLPINFEKLDKPTLANILSKFYLEMRKTDGDYYKAASMNNIRAGINRHLKMKGGNSGFVDIIKDSEFISANVAYRAAAVKLKKIGKAEVQHHSSIHGNDILKLYSSGVFDQTSPTGLQHKVWFELMLYICRRSVGREGLRELKKGDFVVATDPSGRQFISQAVDELTVKNHGDGINMLDLQGRMYETKTDLCPVASFRKYVSKLNPECEAFFQTPRSAAPIDAGPWYKRSPTGKHTLGSIMSQLSKKAGLSKVYTNHCIRATSRPVPALLSVLDSEGHARKVPGRHGNGGSLVSVAGRVGERRNLQISDTLSRLIGQLPTQEVSDSAAEANEKVSLATGSKAKSCGTEGTSGSVVRVMERAPGSVDMEVDSSRGVEVQMWTEDDADLLEGSTSDSFLDEDLGWEMDEESLTPPLADFGEQTHRLLAGDSGSGCADSQSLKRNSSVNDETHLTPKRNKTGTMPLASDFRPLQSSQQLRAVSAVVVPVKQEAPTIELSIVGQQHGRTGQLVASVPVQNQQTVKVHKPNDMCARVLEKQVRTNAGLNVTRRTVVYVTPPLPTPVQSKSMGHCYTCMSKLRLDDTKSMSLQAEQKGVKLVHALRLMSWPGLFSADCGNGEASCCGDCVDLIYQYHETICKLHNLKGQWMQRTGHQPGPALVHVINPTQPGREASSSMDSAIVDAEICERRGTSVHRASSNTDIAVQKASGKHSPGSDPEHGIKPTQPNKPVASNIDSVIIDAELCGGCGTSGHHISTNKEIRVPETSSRHFSDPAPVHRTTPTQPSKEVASNIDSAIIDAELCVGRGTSGHRMSTNKEIQVPETSSRHSSGPALVLGINPTQPNNEIASAIVGAQICEGHRTSKSSIHHVSVDNEEKVQESSGGPVDVACSELHRASEDQQRIHPERTADEDSSHGAVHTPSTRTPSVYIRPREKGPEENLHQKEQLGLRTAQTSRTAPEQIVVSIKEEPMDEYDERGTPTTSSGLHIQTGQLNKNLDSSDSAFSHR